MSDPLPKHLSFEDYLALEETGEIRHELIDSKLYAMIGTTDLHNLIAGGLYTALRSRLRGGLCRVFMENVKVRVEDDAFYPDVFVTCGICDNDRLVKTEPVLIAEVLSPTSVQRDRVVKPPRYRQLASLQAYLLLSQEAPRVERYGPPDWQSKREYGLDDLIDLPELQLALPVREIYEEVLSDFGLA